MKNLIILRGVPGAGKSTLAKFLAGDKGVIVEEDDYHMIDGQYYYKHEDVESAKRKCIDKINEEMWYNEKLIVVSNTNTKASSVTGLIDLAKINGYRYTVLTLENWHGNIDVHNVPADTLIEMRETLSRSIKL